MSETGKSETASRASPVPHSETAAREEEILAFWKENTIFEKSLEKEAPKGEFIFYDGPPFATGLPHVGNLLSSVIKDVVGRYKTMRGYRVPRIWGWDCHGLPIESLVEKKLNLKSKKDILNVGIDVFNETARSMVLQYVHDWKHYVERIGRWVDFENSYKTMDNSYIESVWWTLGQLHNKKLLYEGRRVLMYCPHCETPLAKAEIAMDNTYKDITEEAVTVKFKLKNPQKHGLPEHTYVLAWTTTPWTLPGNVGLAVGNDIVYVVMQQGSEYIVVAKELVKQVSGEISGEFFGKQLVGAEYEPLYRIGGVETHKGKKYVVLTADFVGAEEGTGIVHTAVMYGEDDFALGTKEGLPMVQLLNPNGTYNNQAPEFLRGEYIKKAEKFIKEDLEKRGLLFKKESHTHSYPHCYRCGTPLIYNAVPSWFINIQKVKKRMLAENERINWVPEHLKHGRFKHIVENAPDWTISRNRFWASPLPIWKEKGGSRLMVIGSLQELKEKTKKSGNTYFVMRHGQAQSNINDAMDGTGRPDNHVTEEGRKKIHAAALKLKKRTSLDLIIVSPFLRTRETAKIVQQVYGLPESAVLVDDRLHELNFGPFEGKMLAEWSNFFGSLRERFFKAPEGAESFLDVRRRAGELLFEIERRYVGKKILIVTHKGPGWLLHSVANMYSTEQASNEKEYKPFMSDDQIYPLPFWFFPRNANYELDLHRPYIDAVTLVDEKGRSYERTPEVVDCWVESGAMPYASNHYPFENKDKFNPKAFFGFAPKGFPADFIAEYIAQTRTWFYYMHAIGVLLFNRRSFKNVVSTGTILAADGSKMSKSKGNYTDPLEVMHRFGADALRFHLMGSVVMQAEDLNFRDEDVREAHNRVIGILSNSYKFFELYKAEYKGTAEATNSPHVLDRWIFSRLGEVIQKVTVSLDAYDTPTACRVLRAFIEDYSTWYVRRSRDRVKGDDSADKQFALAAQRCVLLELAKLTAPIMPFIAESIHRGVGGEGESVHLAPWPTSRSTDSKLLSDMEYVRTLASKALEARERAGIKIRQPLGVLKAKLLPYDLQLRQILAEEINVKEIVEDATLEEDIFLDSTITPALREEGMLRDLMRRVQEWRKKEGLSIADRPTHTIIVLPEEKDVAEKYRKEIVKETGLKALEISVE